MQLITFTPTKEDIQRYPHFKNGDCYKDVSGTYECVLCIVGKYRHLKIHRIDDMPIHNYMDFQAIKNQVLGEGVVAVEVYPRASYVKGGGHTYHLWTWDGIETPNLALMPKYS